MFVEIFKIIDYMKSKINQIKNKQKIPKCDVHTLPTTLIAKILYM
jgi:hypothetical protein